MRTILAVVAATLMSTLSTPFASAVTAPAAEHVTTLSDADTQVSVELLSAKTDALPALARPGAFAWDAHPRHLMARIEKWAAIHAERRAARAARVRQDAAGALSSPLGAPAASVNPADFGAFESCVISRESGGQTQVTNASGHWGLFQFAEPTWIKYGGTAANFGNADAKTQESVFSNAMAAGGASNWNADNCPQQFGLDAVSAQLITVRASKPVRARDHYRWVRWMEHKALSWARTQRGKGYCWGGTGPSCYDCSGLVMTAFSHAGFSLPRTAADMQDSRKLERVSTPKPGDIVLYGWPAYHAALYAGHGGRIFDALNSGTPVGSQPDTWPGSPIFYQIV